MRRYEDPSLVTHDEAAEVLNAALASRRSALDPNSVLIGLALHDEDGDFVERWCRRIAMDSHDRPLIATASLALGHLARRFRSLDPESVDLVKRLAADPSLDDRVLSALDDVTLFLEGPSTETE